MLLNDTSTVVDLVCLLVDDYFWLSEDSISVLQLLKIFLVLPLHVSIVQQFWLGGTMAGVDGANHP
jgi:hypothetical protein